ncbi:MAG: serine/threonine protein kinase [Myxococcales bacterium]|nr:serine/threonine protein kinase [Myxococcales bacterium]
MAKAPETPAETADEGLPLGALVGEKFKIVRRVGSGGMGTVYEATHQWTGRRVALKVLHPRIARDKESAQRFLQEARASTEISHPNIVDVLDMGEDPKHRSLYIVQEFLDGDDLHSHLDARGRLSPAESLAILLPVIDALGACHRRGIVHRDVKPENIMLARKPDGALVPKLVDFGVSKVLRRNKVSARITDDGIALGTPQYMSPEQARGDVDLDPRTDLWSIGAVLFECITGSAPFAASTPSLLLVEIITRPPPRLDAVVAGIAPALVEAVARALSPDRNARYRRLEDFAAALRAIPAAALGQVATDAAQRPLPTVSPGARRARPDAPTTILWTGLRTAPAESAQQTLLTRLAIVAVLLSLVALLVVFAMPSRRPYAAVASLPSAVSNQAPPPPPPPRAEHLQAPASPPPPPPTPRAAPAVNPSPAPGTAPIAHAPRRHGTREIQVISNTSPTASAAPAPPASATPSPSAPAPRAANGSVLLAP